MSILVFAIGGALLAGALRWWRLGLSWGGLAAWLALAAAFYSVPPGSGALRVPTDIAYLWRPWAERVALGPEGPRNAVLSDPLLQMLPMRQLVRDRLLHGEAPLWAHALATGQPLLGNAQSAVLSPLELLALPLPPLAAAPVVQAWHLFLALALAQALALALGAGRTGAVFAGLAFGFSTYSIAWSCHPLGMAAAWVPGVLLGLLRLRRGERGGLAGLTACGVGLAVAGHPETLAHTALAVVPVTAWLLWRAAGVPRLTFAAKLAVAAVVAACLAAPALLPVLEALPESARFQAVLRNPEPVRPPLFAAATAGLLVDPLAQGSPRDDNWRGPANFNELASGYAGLAALALALAAALALRGTPLRLLLGGLAALLVALRLPPLFQLVAALPEVGHAAHGRLRLFWTLAVALAAGVGLEALPRRRRAALAAAALSAAAALALALLPPPVETLPWQRAWWLAIWFGTALLAVAFALPGLRRRAPLVAVAVLALDLGLLEWRYVPVVPSRFDLAPPAAAGYLASAMQRSPQPFRVLAEGNDLAPNLGALYGLWDPRGNDPMQPAAAARVVGGGFHPLYRVGRPIFMTRRRMPQALLDYLGVRYLLLGHRVTLGRPWEVAWDGEGGRIWRNPDALPLFFVPARVQPVPDLLTGAASALANADFATLAAIESGGVESDAGESNAGEAPAQAPPMTPARVGPAATGGFATATLQRGRAELRRLTANGFVLGVDSPTGCIVVSSVSHAAGWHVAVDGRPVRALRVNGGFLGFAAPPGRHRVDLDYRPWGWRWGWALWGVGAAVAVGIWGRRAVLKSRK
jgi:Bacterial membrane protein YfhO